MTDNPTAFDRLVSVDRRGAQASPKRDKLDVPPPRQKRLDPATLVSRAHLQAVRTEYLRALLYAKLKTVALETALIEPGMVSEERE